jgi:hypothetical protein
VIAEDPGPREVERVMEELVYEHLVDLIDFTRLHQLQQVVEFHVTELRDKGQLGDMSEEEVADRAAAIVERAWHRIIRDPRRYVDFRGQWAPDDDCELCKALASHRS